MAKLSTLHSVRQNVNDEVIPVAFSANVTYVASAAGDHENIRVIDAWVHTESGAGASTVTIQSGTNAISNAIDANQAVGTITRVGTLDVTYTTVAAGTALNVTCSSANITGTCFILVQRIQPT